ncbi:unnamed protein product [Rotaria sordida]|uniref:Uncharacterized protein n=1 Tax=Rotaria sordida TaxID=392033 RepID=A0A818N461_9BILA|nr:unnamed protein product [Rotaria sordida]
MAACNKMGKNETIPCTNVNTAVYFVVAMIVPFTILAIVIIISIYFRYKNERLRRGLQQQQQQNNMITIIAFDNFDEQQQPQSLDNYSHPPHYTAINNNLYDKPPTYEQTVRQLEETNDIFEDAEEILSVPTFTSSTTQLVQPL